MITTVFSMAFIYIFVVIIWNHLNLVNVNLKYTNDKKEFSVCNYPLLKKFL